MAARSAHISPAPASTDPDSTSALRYAREREFHNRVTDRWRRVSRFYRVTAASQAAYRLALEAHARGRVLEYGCGEGSSGFELAERGAAVVGIDISDARIERARAAAAGLPGELEFLVMNAERLEFPDASFDLVCGTGILHHLDLERALGEVARTLKPTGEGVFLEPLGHNPLINLYRRRTPELRTADEHPLRLSDLELARRFFGRVDARFFHLTSLAAGAVGFRRLVEALDRLDTAAFAGAPFLRRYAWTVVLRLAEPRAPARAAAAVTER